MDISKEIENEIRASLKDIEIIATSWVSISKETRINLLKCNAEIERCLLIESPGEVK